MSLTRLLIYCSLVMTCIPASISAQRNQEPKNQTSNDSKPNLEAPAGSTDQSSPRNQSVESQATVYLVGGGKILVDEVTQTTDGFWYRQGNISTLLDPSKVDRVERASDLNQRIAAPQIPKTGRWRLSDAATIKEFFLTAFNRPLPLSSFGQSDLHDRWGLDHRNGMDVNLHPDSREGRRLIAFLREQSIPFLTFRGPIPGVATGPHIHIGNPSPRFTVR